jgi:nicotinamide riboside transporter PnuC
MAHNRRNVLVATVVLVAAALFAMAAVVDAPVGFVAAGLVLTIVALVLAVRAYTRGVDSGDQ